MTIQTQTVTLPAGVRHMITDAQAISWEAWDALPPDQWQQLHWWTGADCRQCLPTAADARLRVQKEGMIDGCRIVIFRPQTGREARS